MKHRRKSASRIFPVSRSCAGIVAVCLFLSATPFRAQTPSADELAKRLQQLTDAAQRLQTQIEQSQQQLRDLQQQLAAVQKQIGQSAEQPDSTTALAAAVDSLKENQSMLQSEIAVHDQSKVESESKYPVKISGLLLFTSYVNTSAVDIPELPGMAMAGSGTTGGTLRQTVLGIHARGPHILGATSQADLQTDFWGSGYGAASYGNAGFIRLRTAHASLDWSHTSAYFALDRPLLNPEQPTSLTSVASPALAWSGNLWSWNPQAGVRHDLAFGRSTRFRMETALIDAGDAPYMTAVATASATEMSRWPGVESRLAIARGSEDTGFQLGAGGYFAKHKTVNAVEFDAWAGTLDYRFPLGRVFELSGNAYRGLALGGLGGGAYKDYGEKPNPASPGRYFSRPFDDVGGWTQLKARVGERLEFNGAMGIDNVPARQVRRYSVPGAGNYQNLARTQTFMGNVILSPSAWLQLSLDYRYLTSYSAFYPSASSNIFGIAAAYRF